MRSPTPSERASSDLNFSVESNGAPHHLPARPFPRCAPLACAAHPSLCLWLLFFEAQRATFMSCPHYMRLLACAHPLGAQLAACCSIAARSIAARSISSHHCLLSLVYWCSLHHSSLAPSLLHRLVAMTVLAIPPRARLPQALPPRALSRSLVYCCSSTVARSIVTPSSVALSIAMLPRDASLNTARRARTLPSLALACDLVCAAAVLSHSHDVTLYRLLICRDLSL